MTTNGRAVAGVLLAAAVALLAMARWPQHWLETDLMALLPKESRDPLVATATGKLSAAAEGRVVWLIGDRTRARARAAAEDLAGRLSASGLFAAVDYRVDERRFQTLYRTLLPYRFGLLAPADRERLRDNPKALIERRRRELFGSFGVAAAGLANDPLGLFQHYLAQLEPGGGELNHGVVLFAHDGMHYALVVTRSRHTGFRVVSEPPLLKLSAGLRRWAHEHGHRLLATGLPLYSAYGASSAQREINRIGSISLLAVAALMLLVFRSLRPLALALLAIGAGVAGGLATVVLILGHIHVATLVFGAALIGMAVDYALHYLCGRLQTGAMASDSHAGVLPGLRLSLATSVLAFLALAVTPFPGLRQIALFAAGGLTAAWLAVVLWLPALAGRRPPHAPARLTAALQRLPRPSRLWLGLLVIAALPGLWQLHWLDDVRSFYAAPPSLEHDRKVIESILPARGNGRFLLVRAPSKQAVLEREQALLGPLAALRTSGAIASFQAIASMVPSAAGQGRDIARQRALYAPGAAFARFVDSLGFSADARTQLDAALAGAGARRLRVGQWLALADPSWQPLWLGCHDGVCASAIAVAGVSDDGPLQALADRLRGVQWVDPVARISGLIGHYREIALALLGAAIAAALAMLSVAIGFVAALRTVLVPLAAILCAAGVIGYAGGAFSVFNLFALLVVFGMGIDYAIFQQQAAADHRGTTTLAIAMAASTTLLAFGLLSLSETPVISAFGMTLTPGLLAAFVFSFVLGPTEPDSGGES